MATGVFSETRLIDPIFPVAEYVATQVEYTAQRESEVRTGTLYANWSGSVVEYTDVSAVDIGAGRDLTFDFIIFSGNARLRATSNGTGTDGWTIQTMFKMFPNLM